MVEHKRGHNQEHGGNGEDADESRTRVGRAQCPSGLGPTPVRTCVLILGNEKGVVVIIDGIRMVVVAGDGRSETNTTTRHGRATYRISNPLASRARILHAAPRAAGTRARVHGEK